MVILSEGGDLYMPFYEYQCEKCSEIYEIFVRNGDKMPDVCEICGGRLHKIISVSSFHLKGSGWYITDYSKKNTSLSSNKPVKNEKDNNKNKEHTQSQESAKTS